MLPASDWSVVRIFPRRATQCGWRASGRRGAHTLRNRRFRVLGGEEYALDYLVERKSLDDLLGSIADGRYRKQKYVARRSGVRNLIRVRNLVYLCEGQPEAAAFVAASNDADRKSIRSALLTTEVRGFAVVRISPRFLCLIGPS
eukprot:236484-Prorocentrum_minimum.AAC.1